jgi:hypothetical protein
MTDIDQIDWDGVDDTIINTEKNIADSIGFNEQAQKDAVEGIFKLVGPVLDFLLKWIDPDYKAHAGEDELNFTEILKYLMTTNWFAYFSETTLQTMGTLVYEFT